MALKWVLDQGIETALIEPGKPWQNSAAESFNGKFRDECLSLEWFRARAEAKIVIETWRRHFNQVRPHSSLGYLTPAAFAAKLKDTAPADATGLRAPPRRTTASSGGGFLKLSAVRRNRAGQPGA